MEATTCRLAFKLSPLEIPQKPENHICEGSTCRGIVLTAEKTTLNCTASKCCVQSSRIILGDFESFQEISKDSCNCKEILEYFNGFQAKIDVCENADGAPPRPRPRLIMLTSLRAKTRLRGRNFQILLVKKKKKV